LASRGVVAAGHPLTAEAGVSVLREGGNAVDAAVAAALASFSVESALTGFGAGGFMIVQGPGAPATLIDFFVAAPGLGGHELGDELRPVPVHFDATTTQVFNAGAASCAVPGTAAGLSLALERFGSVPISDLIGPAVRYAREGAPLHRQQAYVLRILEAIYTAEPAAREIYAPEGRILREGEIFRYPDLATAIERFAAEGSASIYSGEVAGSLEEYVVSRGGLLSGTDLAAFEAIEREPVAASFHGNRILSNPPPSAGGILIAYSLALLERVGSSDTRAIARAMSAANRARAEEFAAGLEREGFEREFLSEDSLRRALAQDDRLGSTTHLAVMDSDGLCASLTCSNGTGSGMVVPGTGVHLNNMLGEEDLNPLGFHTASPGSRISSMMAPSLVLRDDQVTAGLGSAGSNRIRSAVLQTIVNMLEHGMAPQPAVDAPRVHLEAGILQAEPGTDPHQLDRIEAGAGKVVRWSERNLFFGGVQVVTRNPETGALDGGGDPRRGGAVAFA
jgi:gamma-glutamyltranspeptidase/glutathione hydrolase